MTGLLSLSKSLHADRTRWIGIRFGIKPTWQWLDVSSDEKNRINGDSWTPARAMVLFVEQWAAAPLGGGVSCVRIPIHTPEPTHPSTCSDTPLFPLVMANSYSFFKPSVEESAPQGSPISPSPTQRRSGCVPLPRHPMFTPVHSQQCPFGARSLICLLR